MSSIRKQKGGFRLKAGRRQTLFIRGKGLQDCLTTYCTRTGAALEEFKDSLEEMFGELPEGDPVELAGETTDPDLPQDTEVEPDGEEVPQGDEPETDSVEEVIREGEESTDEPESVEELVADIEDAGEEIPTLEVQPEE